MKEIYYLYLAGPITDMSYGGCTDWRQYAAERMSKTIRVISPLRGKDYLKDEKAVKSSYEQYPLSSGKGITCRDRFDATRCDAVLINLLGAEKVSIGTVLEAAWADAAKKPIILVMEKKGNPHDHPMLKEISGFIVDDLDQAIELAQKILLPGI